MASVSSVNGKKVSKLKFNDTIYDMGGSKNEPITITANGVYTAPEGVGYSPVSVSVPQVAESGTVKNLLDATKSSAYLFYNYKGTSVNELISYSDTSSVTKMNEMFNGCSNLTTIPQLDTRSVTNINNMFRECSNLTTIKLDTSSVTNMSNTFQDCVKLTTIDITHMNNINTMWSFANGCASLRKLIIRNMIRIPPLETNSFKNCFHFDGTVNANFNPQGLKDGRIYVPDDKVEALKTATNWSVYADIIVPLSTLVE